MIPLLSLLVIYNHLPPLESNLQLAHTQTTLRYLHNFLSTIFYLAAMSHLPPTQSGTQPATQPSEVATQMDPTLVSALQTQTTGSALQTQTTISALQTQTTSRRTGHQKGSQGYNGDDCLALVTCVKHVLPLGSNDWNRVHELYEQYAAANGRTPRDPDPLKTKFKALVASKKPTGNPDCPVWIREAKRANMMIKDRAKSLAFVDDDDEEDIVSNNERNGVGNPVRLSPANFGSLSQGTLILGWSATQSQLPNNPLDLDVDPNDESLHDSADISQSSSNPSLAAVQGQNSSVVNRGLASSVAGAGDRGINSTQPQNTRQATTFIQRNQSQTANSASRSTATGPSPSLGQSTTGRQAKASQPAGLHTTLATFFDPDARAARDQETSMSQFYASRLQEANSTIARLQDEINRLHEGVNANILCLQDELRQAQTNLAQKTSDNQDLRHRLEMMQLRLELNPPGGFMQHGGVHGMRAGLFAQSHTHVGTSPWEVNQTGPSAHTQ
ncbi:hypothetical protein PGT21_050331 [Puccinia graminis f. sp. tritici]|nr:hypothetical protein PGT21_050331 [Puccinia graminis f. sp. tritici]